MVLVYASPIFKLGIHKKPVMNSKENHKKSYLILTCHIDQPNSS